MNNDSAMFAKNMWDSMHGEKSVDTVLRAQGNDDGLVDGLKACFSLKTGTRTSPEVAFDDVVSEIVIAAKALSVEKINSETSSESQLRENEAGLSVSTLSRMDTGGNQRDGKILSSVTLTSLFLHVSVFAMVIHAVKAMPDVALETGGSVVNVVMLGNGDLDAIMNGNESDLLNPVEVKADSVSAETITPVETAMSVEQSPAVAPAPPVATEKSTIPLEVPVAPVLALTLPEPDILLATPALTVAPKTAVASVIEVTTAMPTMSPAVQAEKMKLQPLEPDEIPIVSQIPPVETNTDLEELPDLALDIASPIPQPSPWKTEPVPKNQLAAKKKPWLKRSISKQAVATKNKARPVKRQSTGSRGKSTRNVSKGSASGTANTGAIQAAKARTGSSGDGRAAMENYAGKVGRRLRRSVSVERYYRGLGKLQASIIVNVTLTRSGKIASLSLSRSSGNSAVDAIVLQRARAAGPFAPFPASYKGSKKGFTLPLTLKLS